MIFSSLLERWWPTLLAIETLTDAYLRRRRGRSRMKMRSESEGAKAYMTARIECVYLFQRRHYINEKYYFVATFQDAAKS